MSSAFAIAGVTQLLRDLLDDGLIAAQLAGTLGTTVLVTALPPDRIVPATGGSEPTQLNLFLRLITPNLGWRNEELPARDRSGRKLTNPPLAIDLHYLLSAHGAEDLHAEILLGHAMLLLHENGIVPRARIRAALQPPGGPGVPAALRTLVGSGLETQLEQLKISPEYLSSEEISKFWTATQSHYRPCAAYVVSVVLLQSSDPARAPLPVLERRLSVEPGLVPPIPTLEAIVPAGGQPAVTLGTTITLRGHHLGAGPGRKVVLSNDRFAFEATREASNTAGEQVIELELPAAEQADFPAGFYRVAARVQQGSQLRETNQLPFALAPELTGLPTQPVPRVAGTASFSVDFRPELRAGQTVRLVLGQRECTPEPFSTPTSSLSFVVPDAAPGTHQVRLRVDGVDSPLLELSGPAPTFNDRRIVIQ